MNKVKYIIVVLLLLFLYKVNTDEYMFYNEVVVNNLNNLVYLIPICIIFEYLIQTNDKFYNYMDNMVEKLENFIFNLLSK